MKVFLLIHTYTDFPTEIEVYDSRAKAELAFYKKIGESIVEAIRENDREFALRYVEKMQPDTLDEFYMLWADGEEIYIEEKEIM